MVACHAGSLDCARALLIAGCDPLLKDLAYDRTALHHAAAVGATDVVELLLSDEWTVTMPRGTSTLKDAVVFDSVGTNRWGTDSGWTELSWKDDLCLGDAWCVCFF
jgi:hypothetical protein